MSWSRIGNAAATGWIWARIACWDLVFELRDLCGIISGDRAAMCRARLLPWPHSRSPKTTPGSYLHRYSLHETKRMNFTAKPRQAGARPAGPGFGAFVISLDFELHWGVRDHERPNGPYGPNLLGARKAIPRLLELFERYG